MWPAYVDFNDEDCKKVLRTLELDAYSSIINAFRAQGTLTKDRKRILEELCQALGISTERHRAEIRRAVNDEHLNTIAERLFGPNTITGWTTEGRRLIPIMSRLGPQTVFTEIANSIATAQAEKNTLLQYPGKTGRIEMINGIETMACRKRKEGPPECSYASPPPPKIPAVEHFNNVLITECTDITCLTPSTLENSLSAEGTKTSSSTTDVSFPRSTVPLMTSTPNPSPLKSTSKHPMMKVPSTVTTFSSFDQMTSNLMASRGGAHHSASSAVLDEVTIISEAGKSVDLKNAPRPLTSIGSMKSSTIVIPTSTSSTCSTATSKECMLTTPISSQNNKFVTQIRAKAPTNARANLPAGLGIKMSPQQSPMRPTLPPKSPSMKLKHDSSSIFAKKTPPNVFSDHQAPQFSSSSSSSSSSLDIITPSKNPLPSKLNSKSDTPTILTHQPSVKQNTLTKSLPKTTGGSQYLSRSLFSTAKPGPKNLTPVIFNVSSSSSCSPVQTTTKTSGTLQMEAKSNSQLLPKTTSVSVTSNQLKINTSNSQQTIQYRNDGGLVRSARIVNITQPVGSRLPCAITPSAISALGLTTGISPTALRVTLPAGTLNSSSAIRVSTAAKPNVIVVHKAQVWQGSQQNAVIMSSTSLPKLTNDSPENPSQKSEKTKPIIKSTSTRPTASGPRPQSPIVTSSLAKTSENSSLSNPTTSGPSVEISNSKYSESMTDAQCKMNLLADVIEASGILLDSNSPEKSGKGHCNKNNYSDVPNHQEAGISIKTSSPFIEETFKLSESNACNSDTMTSASESSKSVTKIDKNGVEIKLPLSQFKSVEIQRKESSNTINSSLASGSIVSSSECESKVLKEADKSS